MVHDLTLKQEAAKSSVSKNIISLGFSRFFFLVSRDPSHCQAEENFFVFTFPFIIIVSSFLFFTFGTILHLILLLSFSFSQFFLFFFSFFELHLRLESMDFTGSVWEYFVCKILHWNLILYFFNLATTQVFKGSLFCKAFQI